MITSLQIEGLIAKDSKLKDAFCELIAEVCNAAHATEMPLSNKIEDVFSRATKTMRKKEEQLTLFNVDDAKASRTLRVFNRKRGANNIVLYRRNDGNGYSMRLFKEFTERYVVGREFNHFEVRTYRRALYLFVTRGKKNCSFGNNRVEFCDKHAFEQICTCFAIDKPKGFMNVRVIMSENLSQEKDCMMFKLLKVAKK